MNETTLTLLQREISKREETVENAQRIIRDYERRLDFERSYLAREEQELEELRQTLREASPVVLP